MPHKKRRCTGCGNSFPKEEFWQIATGANFHTKECFFNHIRKPDNVKKLAEKGEKIKRQYISSIYRQKPKKRTGLSHQRDLTQKVFNKMRVLEEMVWFKSRAIEPYCISCLRENMDWCCGHYKTRGSHPELALDPMNTYLQCNKHCNSSLSGNIEGNKHSIGYKQGIIHRFGEKAGNEILEYLEQPHEPKRYREDDYKKLRKKYRERIRELELALSKM